MVFNFLLVQICNKIYQYYKSNSPKAARNYCSAPSSSSDAAPPRAVGGLGRRRCCFRRRRRRKRTDRRRRRTAKKEPFATHREETIRNSTRNFIFPQKPSLYSLSTAFPGNSSPFPSDPTARTILCGSWGQSRKGRKEGRGEEREDCI